jgi:hypothetical protein
MLHALTELLMDDEQCFLLSLDLEATTVLVLVFE